MKDEVGKLIHAYLDGELSPDEANRLIAEIKADRAAAKELKALERLSDRADALPAPRLPPDFLARTLARLDRTPQRPVSLLDRWRARKVELSVPQLALAAGLALAVMALPWLLHARGPSAPHEDGLVAVQFTLSAPQAHRVQVAGDFNGWNPKDATLTRQSDGTYRMQLKLPHGRYQYQFVVDGDRWVPDPLAVDVVDDGFGGKNAVLDI